MLTEQEIREAHEKHSSEFLFEDTINFARAIEAKVIEKIKAQGATAYLEGNPEGIWFVAYSVNTNAPQIPLYRLPEGE